MSFLRQRKPQTEPQGEETPATAEEIQLAPVSKIHKAGHRKHASNKRRNGFIFFLGGLFGLLLAGLVAKQSDIIPEMGGLESIINVLPKNFVQDARDLAVRPFR